MSSAAEVLSPQEERIEAGQEIGLLTEDAQRKRARIHRMLEGFRDKPIRLNLQRARLLTESFEETEGQPCVLRWGKALAHVLSQIEIHVDQDELIVGSSGPPGPYAVFYPELEERFFSEDVRPSEPGDRLMLTEEDVRVINEELRPYWQGKQYHPAYMNALPEDTRRLIELFFVVTPTATARSSLAWNHDYEKVLKRGIKGIEQEAREKLTSLDPLDPKDQVEKAPFLNAVILVCDAIVGFARRHSKLARSMAEEESDEARKRELFKIAEVCDWVPENPARTFHEAIQSQWLIQTVSRLEQRIGGTVGNGRIDQYLYPFYRKDIDEGRITRDEALELLECLWIGMAKHLEIYTTAGNMSYTDGYAHWEATTIGGQKGRKRCDQRALVSDASIQEGVPAQLSRSGRADPRSNPGLLPSCGLRNHQGRHGLPKALLRRGDHSPVSRERRAGGRGERLLHRRMYGSEAAESRCRHDRVCVDQSGGHPGDGPERRALEVRRRRKGGSQHRRPERVHLL
jgi:formate C-acetyltransferase